MNPIYTLKGKNYLRIFSVILLILILGLTIYCSFLIGLVFVYASLASLFGLFCIRFSRINIYNNRIEILRNGILKRFNDKIEFNFSDIETIEFSRGFIDWNYAIVLALFGSGGFGGNSKADQMIIKTKNNQTEIFNRFGKRNKFIETIEIVQKQINPATNIASKVKRVK